VEFPWKFIYHICIRLVLFGVFVEIYRMYELSSEESHRTLSMADEYVHNNPQDLAEEIFERLEEKVVDISCNMALLMVVLARKIIIFGDVGGSN
jgi:hypothetical protein